MMTLIIDGIDRTALLSVNSVDISDQLNSRNTMTFVLKDPTGSYIPDIGDEVILTKDGTRVFGGTIDDYDAYIVPGTSMLRINVSCVDYNQLSDRHIVARTYENMLAGDIIRDIVSNDLSGEGITSINVEDGPMVTKAVFNYVTAAQAFDEICELTGYAWNIDYNKDLHFFARESKLAPFSISETSGNFRKIRVRKTRNEYRNTQYVRAGYDVTDERTEQFLGDGVTASFPLGFPAAEMLSAKIDGVEVPVGIRGLNTSATIFWGHKESIITKAGPLANGSVLEITYRGYVPVIVAAQNEEQIEERKTKEGGTGIYEAVMEDQNINTRDLAFEKANAILRKYGKIQRIVSFETDVDGLQAGQLISIEIPQLNLSGNFLIGRIRARDISGQFLRYTVDAYDGETFGGWIEFFKKLAQAGRKFVIRENEVLMALRRKEEELVIADIPTTDSAEVGLAKVGIAEVSFSETPFWLSDSYPAFPGMTAQLPR